MLFNVTQLNLFYFNFLLKRNNKIIFCSHLFSKLFCKSKFSAQFTFIFVTLSRISNFAIFLKIKET